MPKIIQKTKTVKIREYLRNYNQYNSFIRDGQTFILTNKNENIAVLSPVEKDVYSLRNLLKMRFTSKTNETDISNNIDAIVYGI